MKAKEFFRIAASKLRPPTERKTMSLARKLGLRDTQSEIFWYTGIGRDKMSEFIID